MPEHRSDEEGAKGGAQPAPAIGEAHARGPDPGWEQLALVGMEDRGKPISTERDKRTAGDDHHR